MSVRLGYLVVAVGAAASLTGMVSLAVASVKGRSQVLRQAWLYTAVVAASALAAFVIMEVALIRRDFTFAYVAEVGSSRTPALYNFTALWSSLEGSILLWMLVLALYLVLVTMRFRNRLDDPMVGWALTVMFGVCSFFFLLMLGPANPFQSFDPPVGYDGLGPNPLLQNHILVVFHPPVLYLGYVGFTVPFAFAIAALVTGRLGEGWLIETRRATLFVWAFLTVGIILGAWWSYEVLGWGGYWAWDPVENVSLLPWLTGTAYLHSVMVQERRGMLRVWNLSLVCATFALTILGTFLTRSGVIDSVHAFSESDIGPWLLGFFALVSAVAIGLIAWRGDALRSPGQIDSPLSREGAFLANNLLFAAFAFVVLLGTVAPLLVEAWNDERISVGGPYFDTMARPIGLVLLFLMAVAPALPWRKTTSATLGSRLLVPAWIGGAAMVVSLLLGARGWAPVLAFGLGGFAGGSAARTLVLATRRQGWRGLVGRTNGGMVVHIGVIVMAVAIAASSAFVRQGEFSIEQGASVSFAGHTITYLREEVTELPERTERSLVILLDGEFERAPALSFYPSFGRSIGTPSVRSTPTQDVHLSIVALPDATTGTPPVIRMTIQPMIVWLWIGGLIVVVGTLLSAFPGRRRRGTEPVSAELPGIASRVRVDGAAGREQVGVDA